MRRVKTDEERVQTSVDADARRHHVKGNGWLEKRGRFYVACWKFSGKLYKRTTKETTETRAREKLAQFTAPFRTARTTSIAAALGEVRASSDLREKCEIAHLPVLEVGSAFEAFVKLPRPMKLAESTQRDREAVIDEFAKYIHDQRKSNCVEMRDIGIVDAENFIRHTMSRGVSLQTCANRIGHLKATWKAIKDVEDRRASDKTSSAKINASIDGLPPARLTINPWELIADDYSPKAIKAAGAMRVKREPFTMEEMRRIFDNSEGEMHTLFLIGAHLGLRLGDAATLKWGDNIEIDDGETGKLTITPAKTSRTSSAVVRQALGRELHDALLAIPTAVGRTGYLMPELADLYTSCPAKLSTRVQYFFRKIGIKTSEKRGSRNARSLKGFHSFRYSFVSMRANRGEDIDAIRRDVGHSTTGMTEQYHVKDDATLEREAATVSDFFSASQGTPTTAQGRERAIADEFTREDVKDDQRPVYDAVCAMLAKLEPQTLRSVASEALRLAMKTDAGNAAAAEHVA